MHPPSKHTHLIGFSLMELITVIAIIGVLAAVAYPNYLKFQTEARRTDAHASLIQAKGTITEHLVLYNIADLKPEEVSAINLNPQSKNKLYNIAIDATGAGYKIIATATGIQAKDKKCKYIVLDNQGYKSSSDENLQETYGCW